MKRINLFKLTFFSLALLMLLMAVLSSAWSYQRNYITVYADGVSHLNIARRVVDNLQPGVAQLGGSWLPAYHVLVLPLVQSSYLWHSGLAGTIVSEISYIFAGLLIFLIVHEITKSKTLAFLSAVAFGLTPDVIYMATTPMTEIFTIFLLLASNYFLLKWLKTGSDFNLLLSSLFVGIGVLTRYEVWFYAVLSIPLIALIDYLKHKNLQKSEGMTILYSTPIALAFFLWIGWNFIIFHDPLYFMHGNFSARAYQIPLELSGDLPTKGSIINALYYYLQALVLTNGLIYVLVSFISLIVFYAVSFKKYNYLILLALAGPIIFEVISLFTGSTALWVPNLHPFRMYNIRYGLYGAALIFVFLPLAFYKIKKIGIVVLSVLIVLQIFMFSKAGLPITLKDGLVGRTDSNGKAVLEGAEYLKDHYQEGKILAPSGALDPLIFATGLSNKTFITEGAKKYWDEALINPDDYASWVVLTNSSSGVNIRDGIQAAIIKNPKLLDHYNLVYKKGAVLIYKKK